LQDITASVDFTAVADAAVAAGLEVAGYASQNHFLFGCGLMDLLADQIPVSPPWEKGGGEAGEILNPVNSVHYLEQARQVKLLTLPGEMGDRFQAMALTRNLDIPLRGFAFRDQRGRL
jgi:SAM-dependent MidA family methyltransferase